MREKTGDVVRTNFAGAMANETLHFLEAVAYDRPVLVTAEHARMVMEVYLAADLSAERNEPVPLPLADRKDNRPCWWLSPLGLGCGASI